MDGFASTGTAAAAKGTKGGGRSFEPDQPARATPLDASPSPASHRTNMLDALVNRENTIHRRQAAFQVLCPPCAARGGTSSDPELLPPSPGRHPPCLPEDPAGGPLHGCVFLVELFEWFHHAPPRERAECRTRHGRSRSTNGGTDSLSLPPSGLVCAAGFMTLFAIGTLGIAQGAYKMAVVRCPSILPPIPSPARPPPPAELTASISLSCLTSSPCAQRPSHVLLHTRLDH